MDPINNAAAPGKPNTFVKAVRIIVAIVAVAFILLDCKVLADLWENRDKTANNPLEPYRNIAMARGFRCALVLALVALAAYAVLLITRKVALTIFFPILALVQNCAYYIVIGQYDESASKLLFWQKDKPWAYGPNSAIEWIQSAKRMQLLVIFMLLLMLLLVVLNIRKGWRWPLLIAALLGFGLIEAEGSVVHSIKYINESEFVAVGNYMLYPVLTFLYALVYPKKKKAK